MSSSLLIKPKVSLYLFFLFCFLYILSFTLFIFMHVTLLAHVALCLLLVIHFLYAIRRHVFYRHPLSVARLWFDGSDEWKLQCKDSHVRTAKLFQSIMISRYYVFLAFRVPGRWLPLPVSLAIDSDDAESMRCLRRLLQQH